MSRVGTIIGIGAACMGLLFGVNANAADTQLFADGWGTNWSNWSWKAGVNISADNAKVGGLSLKVVVNSPGGTLSMHSSDLPRQTADFEYVSFWINPTTSVATVGGLKVSLENDENRTVSAGTALSAYASPALATGAWSYVRLPMRAVSGELRQFSRIDLGGAGPNAVYYLDEVVVEPKAGSVLSSPAVAQFRGVNIGNMEMSYADFNQDIGPIEGVGYPKHDNRLLDYFISKRVSAIRLLFSWEGMQSALFGSIPAAASGNYKRYFDNYTRLVEYGTSRGVQIIVEPWQANSSGGAGGAMYRGKLVGSSAVSNAAFQDFWTKMASVFKANPRVMFGLVNEPNNQSTMQWWSAAQAAVNGIRGSGATQRIFIPGNGYSGASSWTQNWYDTASVKRSNAYGWLNAGGIGLPIRDPMNNIAAEVHTYLDSAESGGTTEIVAVTSAREHLAVAVNEAKLRGYKVYLGEIGFYADARTNDGYAATAAWRDFIAYANANLATLLGYSWWASGSPGWWDDIAANGGGHFSVTPTNGATFSGDTVNMNLIQNDFY
jgi:endoglucanase